MTAGYPRYPNSRGLHRGIDWGIPEGTKVGAAYSGTVVAVEKNNFGRTGYGNFVRILGDNGRYFRYGHLSKPTVNIGDKVSAGTLIGFSSSLNTLMLFMVKKLKKLPTKKVIIVIIISLFQFIFFIISPLLVYLIF